MERCETILITRSFNASPDPEPGNRQATRQVVVYLRTVGSAIQEATPLGPNERQAIEAAITELNRLPRQADVDLGPLMDSALQLGRQLALDGSGLQEAREEGIDQSPNDISAVLPTTPVTDNRKI